MVLGLLFVATLVVGEFLVFPWWTRREELQLYRHSVEGLRHCLDDLRRSDSPSAAALCDGVAAGVEHHVATVPMEASRRRRIEALLGPVRASLHRGQVPSPEIQSQLLESLDPAAAARSAKPTARTAPEARTQDGGRLPPP